MNLTEDNNQIYRNLNPENETPCEELGYESGFTITERVNKSELKECYIEIPILLRGFLNKQLPEVGINLIWHKKENYIEIKFCFILSGTNSEIEQAHEQMENNINKAILTIIK